MQKRGYENFLIGKIIKTIYQKSKKNQYFSNFWCYKDTTAY